MGVAEKSAEVAASYVSMEAEIPEVLYRGMLDAGDLNYFTTMQLMRLTQVSVRC